MKKKIFLVAICFVVAIFAFNGVSAASDENCGKEVRYGSGESVIDFTECVDDVSGKYAESSMSNLFSSIVLKCHNKGEAGFVRFSRFASDAQFDKLVNAWNNVKKDIDGRPNVIINELIKRMRNVRTQQRVLTRLRSDREKYNNDDIEAQLLDVEAAVDDLKEYVEKISLLGNKPSVLRMVESTGSGTVPAVGCMQNCNKTGCGCVDQNVDDLIKWLVNDAMFRSGEALRFLCNYSKNERYAKWADLIRDYGSLNPLNSDHLKKLADYVERVTSGYSGGTKLTDVKNDNYFRDVAELYVCRKGKGITNFFYSAANYTDADAEYAVFASKNSGNLCSDVYDYDKYYNRNGYLSYEQYQILLNTGKVTENILSWNTYAVAVFSGSINETQGNWWWSAWKFLNSGKNSSHQFGTNTGADAALNDIKDMIFDVGNVIFLLVTAYLGVKYIWGGVDSKFTVKNSLMTLIVAAIVFYGWNSVTAILDIEGLFTSRSTAASETTMVNKIYNTIMYIINFAAVGGIIYIGIRYMMAGADGKAELKLKGIPVVMGIMMVYGTLNFINFILKIVEGL